jgi:hypothetical protein
MIRMRQARVKAPDVAIRSESWTEWPGSLTATASERMRWIADYLDLADKAISVIACVEGLDYPSECHRGAQQDLRRWARWLEARPTIAAGFAVGRLTPGPEELDGSGQLFQATQQ